jgi:Zn-dependent peptidase ImmA (M78 family)
LVTKRLRRGFRKEAEEYAEDFRRELNLAPHDPLSPLALAELLGVPVFALSTHPTIEPQVKAYYRGAGQSEFSATSLPLGSYRQILHNDYQHANRQNSNVMHELSHIILGHPPKPPLLGDSCRNFDPVAEEEANQLGFTLLIPKPAALYAFERFRVRADAAEYYGVSVSLLNHRIQITDVRGWSANRTRRGVAAVVPPA